MYHRPPPPKNGTFLGILHLRWVDRACPGLNTDVRKRELLDRFIDGLPDSVPPPPIVDHYEEEISQSEEEPEQLEKRRPRNRGVRQFGWKTM